MNKSDLVSLGFSGKQGNLGNIIRNNGKQLGILGNNKMQQCNHLWEFVSGMNSIKIESKIFLLNTFSYDY